MRNHSATSRSYTHSSVGDPLDPNRRTITQHGPGSLVCGAHRFVPTSRPTVALVYRRCDGRATDVCSRQRRGAGRDRVSISGSLIPRRRTIRGIMCQVTVVSPLLFRRHWTERPTWPREGPTWTCSGGVSPSHHRGPHPDPCASAANVRAFLRAAHHPRLRLCRVCALAVPLGTPACAGPPCCGGGTFLGTLAGTVGRPRSPGGGPISIRALSFACGLARRSGRVLGTGEVLTRAGSRPRLVSSCPRGVAPKPPPPHLQAPLPARAWASVPPRLSPCVCG